MAHLPQAIAQWIAEHPRQTAFVIAGTIFLATFIFIAATLLLTVFIAIAGAVLFAPFITVPVLTVLGFTASGVAAGE
jgi:nitrogen fixation/metabolism regulation signal transduction histidine kinase